MRSKKYTSRISIARNAYLRSSAVLNFFLVVVGVMIGDLRGVLRRLVMEDLEWWDDGEGDSIFVYVFVEELCVAVMRLMMILWEDE
mmetsp:Transcript_17674/g.26838  ORF Transcript_17674/g.26838 Transcript_17674/m.26838 type:complete len:86 (-) Transcript_17674:86-343(-)